MPASVTVRDKITRLLLSKQEPQLMALKLITRNTQLPLKTRIKAQLEIQKYSKYFRPVSVTNRCTVFGKSRVFILQ
jgi:hypothetical protein